MPLQVKDKRRKCHNIGRHKELWVLDIGILVDYQNCIYFEGSNEPFEFIINIHDHYHIMHGLHTLSSSMHSHG